MYRKDRAEDQDFARDELLYRRYLQQHFFDNCFSDLGFRFSDVSGQSVNRERYSEPGDVLFLENGTFCEGWGVLAFAVHHIPSKIDGVQFTYVFTPKHVPKELNYAHSEVWCDTDKGTGGYVRPDKTVRKKLRTMLGQHVSVKITAER